jgi:hypothetical protein
MSRYRIVAALALLLPCVLSAQTHAPKLVDVHVHFNGEQGVLASMLDKLNRVDGLAILLATPKGLQEAEGFVHDHPDRFVGFCDVKLDDPGVLRQVDHCHEIGFRGLGEITSTRLNYDDPGYWPIYERAQRYGLMLLFHTGVVQRLHPEQPEDISFDRMRATRLDLIARRFPGLTVIGAHLGNPDYAEAAEIARWSPNLYFDVSGSTLIKKQNDYTFFRSIFWWSDVQSPHTPSSGRNAFEKLVFGSDVFGGDVTEFDRELERYHRMLDACSVPAQSQDRIFAGTMWEILTQQGRQAAAK